MQDSSAFQYIAIDQIHESTTKPRQTFEQTKLEELAAYVPGNIIGILWR
jgi:ParB family transcriptional regulator, chromosome partitioning protein